MHTVEDSHTPLCEIIHMFASEGVFQSWLFPVAGTLTRAPPGSDQFSVWDVKETYRVKVVSAKNTNVAENHRVRAIDNVHLTILSPALTACVLFSRCT